MIEKRAYRRSDANSAPGTLVVDGRRVNVDFDNISLIGARVKARGEKLPPIGSLATLNMENEDFEVSCKVVGLDSGDFYRLKFDGISEGALNYLLSLLRRLSGGDYEPKEDLPNLILDLG